MRTAILLAFGAVLAAQAFPHSGDTNVVESMIREVRAVAPDDLADLITKDTKKAFLHTYGDDDDNEQGYNKKVDDEGGKGYKHFDSYHKKDSDKYGFETQTAFGKGEGSETEAGSSKSGKYSETQEDNGEADKSEDTEEDEADDGDEEETKHSYQVVEDVDEDGESGHYTEGSEGYNSSDFHGDDDDGESKSYHQIEADDNDEDDDDN